MAKTEKIQQFVGRLTGGTLVPTVDFRFSKKERLELHAVIAATRPISRKKANLFIGALELAVARYKTFLIVEQEKVRETALRDALIKIDKAATDMKKALAAYSGQDHRHVLELGVKTVLLVQTPIPLPPTAATEEDMLAYVHAARQIDRDANDFLDNFPRHLDTLVEALSHAKKFKFETRSGPLKLDLRTMLATAVAKLFKSSLEIEPTTTQDAGNTQEGPFAGLLRIVIHAAGVEINDVHRLARKAVKQLKAIPF